MCGDLEQTLLCVESSSGKLNLSAPALAEDIDGEDGGEGAVARRRRVLGCDTVCEGLECLQRDVEAVGQGYWQP